MSNYFIIFRHPQRGEHVLEYVDYRPGFDPKSVTVHRFHRLARLHEEVSILSWWLNDCQFGSTETLSEENPGPIIEARGVVVFNVIDGMKLAPPGYWLPSVQERPVPRMGDPGCPECGDVLDHPFGCAKP